MRKLDLPSGETPQSAYDLAMTSGSFFQAAQIATQFALGGDKIRQAARLAISRYMENDRPDMALNAIAVFGVQYPFAMFIERGTQPRN